MKRVFWVRIRAEGLNLERFIDQLGAGGIELRQVQKSGRKLTGLIREKHLPQARELALLGGWALERGQRQGAGRAADLLARHWGLAAALLLAFALLGAAAQAMWRIEIAGAGVYRQDIAAFLSDSGIKPMMWKRDVDIALLRDKLTWRYPGVARLDCGWRGMTLRISVNEGYPEGECVGIAGERDLVALRDGVVDSVVVWAGTAKVKAGDVVRRGQVLIAGEERGKSETAHSVIAAGQVMARVWDGARARVSATEEETKYTGQTQQVTTVSCPLFDLWKGAEAPFGAYDTAVSSLPLGGFFLPLQVRWEERLELSASPRLRDLEQVKAEAAIAGMRLLRQRIGIAQPLVDKYVKYSMIENETVEALVIGERVMDIAARPVTP